MLSSAYTRFTYSLTKLTGQTELLDLTHRTLYIPDPNLLYMPDLNFNRKLYIPDLNFNRTLYMPDLYFNRTLYISDLNFNRTLNT